MIKKREKKAQITIFVIIAIVLIVAVAGLFIIKNNSTNNLKIVQEDISPINQFVQDCLKITGENALIRIGEQGGYFILSEDIPSIDGRIPYYFINNKSLILSNEEIESNLAGFVREELGFCILNFKDFKSDFGISGELNKVSAKIYENKVSFSLNYPLTIIKKNSTFTLKNFNIDISNRIGKLNTLSEELVIEQAIHPESICLSCLYDSGNKYNVSIDLLDYGNSTIFSIIDDNSKINNQSYEWSFAIK